ncbi:MAG: hypothetical protein AAB922_04365 [Patescibacteria group bacterium]
MDFSTYLFHCSGLANLMVVSRVKSDPLSQTTKSFLQDIFIQEVYKRKKYTDSKYTKKGTMVEPDTMDLVKTVTGKTYFKNNKTLANEWITGTPDIITLESIKDVKSSWDLWTFAEVSEKKARDDYYYQMLGYMWLSGLTRAELMYGLVNTPEFMVEDELKKIYLLNRLVGDFEVERYKPNYIFDDIPATERLKRYVFEFSEEDVESVKQKITLSREYLNTLSL